MLVFEDIEGRHPRTPWVEDELDAAVRALGDLADALTPSPVPDAPTAADHLRHDLGGWRRIAADPPADLDPWVAEHLDDLVAAAERALAALAGDTLVHCDIRADNMLLRPDGSLVFVDWPWGSIGPAWLDRALLALNVLVHGGDGDRILAELADPAAADGPDRGLHRLLPGHRAAAPAARPADGTGVPALPGRRSAALAALSDGTSGTSRGAGHPAH